MIRAVRPLVVAVLVAAVVSACSSGQPSTFTLSGASVDPTHWCPGGSNNAPYDLHATIEARNGRTSAVTIQAVTASMTLAAITGNWLEKIGDRFEADKVQFSPSTVAGGANTKLNVTFSSACTSGAYNAGTSSQGDYVVTMHVTTSMGQLSITASNRHSIVAA
jgi:hypothetical protein